MTAPFVHELRVRYAECDIQGIVFNANYLMYYDVAYTELWRATVGTWDELNQRGFDAVVSETNLRFRGSARYDELIQLRCTVTSIGETSITTQMNVHRGDELLVEGWIRHVVVDRETWAKTPVPDWIREGLARHAVNA